ncbi:MAG: tRNA (adenosine(37)-N6)-threonylcarbamoyltransferase complex ATPase subunit type 1 TsaE [Bacteroidetes bacterium SW_4_67_19]|nr:MAG: tRNA (adenosine(37)-N6)-threonylcarbamoyltransferase complex ATPase subunit type 1 TsaE [Bacteroidetes bacterium SW_4_67_19]
MFLWPTHTRLVERKPKAKNQRPKTLFPAETDAPEATRALGRRLASHLVPGAVVALYGDLGAGKTQFVKGAAAALGIDERDVRSPTFVIAREYDGHWPEGHTRAGATARLYHLDAYRLGGPSDLRAVDYETYFFGDGLCFIEWPERVEALLPEGALRLRLEHLDSERRRVFECGREETK